MSTGSAARAKKPQTTELAVGVVIARKDHATYVTGRRDWMKYRELGVTKASEGRIRAQVSSASQSLSEPTGWHIHLCEGQFVYMLNGWIDLEFTGGRVERDLARKIHGVACLYGLRVRADGGGGLVGMDDLLGHGLCIPVR